MTPGNCPSRNRVSNTSEAPASSARAPCACNFSTWSSRFSSFGLYVSTEVPTFRRASDQSSRWPSSLLRRSTLSMKVATALQPASFRRIFPSAFTGVKFPIVSSVCSRQSFHRGHKKNVCFAVSSSCPHDLQKGVWTLFELYKYFRKYPCPVRNCTERNIFTVPSKQIRQDGNIRISLPQQMKFAVSANNSQPQRIIYVRKENFPENYENI